MNEQLIVKNFGPIKDATVDFKRVTVFIGPTGGGKSTLAKLAAIFHTNSYSSQAIKQSGLTSNKAQPHVCLEDFNLSGFKKQLSFATLLSEQAQKFLNFDLGEITIALQDNIRNVNLESYDKSNELVNQATSLLSEANSEQNFLKKKRLLDDVMTLLEKASSHRIMASEMVNTIAYKAIPQYIPSERSFITSITSSFAGLMRDDIGLSKPLLAFANAYFQSRDETEHLEISFLNIDYFRHDNKDYISLLNDSKQNALLLNEAASGIQSVTPLLVLLEHLSRNTEQAQSFIIEEPELNLYPTAQQGLLNWLVEKCTKGENDLTITTHSPYILSHLNLLLYAYQVAEKHPERADEVAEVVPRASWINPKEFACYQVENGGATSLVSEDLGLIDDNGLDNLSGDAADAFDNLIRLSKGVARK